MSLIFYYFIIVIFCPLLYIYTYLNLYKINLFHFYIKSIVFIQMILYKVPIMYIPKKNNNNNSINKTL